MSRPCFPDEAQESLPPALSLDLGDLTLTGVSVAARATGFVVTELGVALDLGRMSRQVARQGLVLLSHGHLDHTAGVLAYLNTRARFHRGEATLVMAPAAVAEGLRQALTWMPGMESVRSRLDLDGVLVGVEPGQSRLVHGLEVTAFAADHGVPSLGWSLRREGHNRPALVYGGDGSTVPFERNPEILDAGVVVVESTFVAPSHRAAARIARHAHVMDWIELAPQLACDTLVLAHLPEWDPGDLTRCAAPLSQALAGRLVLWSRRPPAQEDR